MSHSGRTSLTACVLLSAALWLLTSCGGESTPAQAASLAPVGYSAAPARAVLSGTRIRVALAVNLSSETASAGDAWRGSVTETVRTLNGGLIPAGSMVEGVVAAATPATRGARAMLELGVQSIRVNDHDESIAASAEPVMAGASLARGEGADVVLPDGTVVSFTVSHTVAMR